MDALINVVVPVFGIVLTGYLAGHYNILGPDSAAALNRYVYYFALPPVLFVFTARAPIDKVLNWPFIGAFLGGSALTLVIALLVGRFWLRLGSDELSVHALAAVFANTAYMGIPLFLTAFGPEGALPAIVGTLAATTILIGGAIAALESTRAAGPSLARIVSQVSATLVRNPILIASPVLKTTLPERYVASRFLHCFVRCWKLTKANVHPTRTGFTGQSVPAASSPCRM